jgi:hypothetical protein
MTIDGPLCIAITVCVMTPLYIAWVLSLFRK